MSGEKKAVSQQEPQQESLFSRMARRDDEDEDDDDGDDDPNGTNAADEDDDVEDQIPVESMEQVSRFQDITVWEHEIVPSAEESFSKGVNEWLAFAQAIHGTTASES